MTGGGGEAPPPANGGAFLLQLLKNPPRHPPEARQPPPQSQLLTHDPAVAAIGPSTPIPFSPTYQPDGITPIWPQHHYQHSPPPPFAPRDYLLQNPNAIPGSDSGSKFSHDDFGNDLRKPGLSQATYSAGTADQKDKKGLIFGSFGDKDGSVHNISAENLSVSHQGHLSRDSSRRLKGVEVGFQSNSADFHWDKRGSFGDSRSYVQERRNYSSGDGDWDRKGHKELYCRGTVALPGITIKQSTGYTNRRSFEQIGERGSTDFGKSKYQSGKGERDNKSFFKNPQDKVDRWGEQRVNNKLDSSGVRPVSKFHSPTASSALELHGRDGENREICINGTRETTVKRDDCEGEIDLDDLEEQLADALVLGDEVDEKSEKGKHHRSRAKDYRSDKRGQSIMGQRMRCMKRQLACRGDIDRWNIPFLAIYESLIPAEEEKAKQKQLLALLENIVSKEWPGARLYLYGSCANSFGFSKSDIDVCLTIEDADIDKSEVLLKLADLLESENLLNVQALTRARVPIVKLMDPTTGISCDICVNNVLAVVNTKLLRDYAAIDVRLRQLAFMVKHWAKSRGVNETYQGTLSSYAYVLMCIHFLQMRTPAILPCLQEMTPTCSVSVDDVECAYFDCVEKLVGYGSHNRESISHLLWAFFRYWAYCHDYTNDVISVRTGCVLSKRFKDWTRRIGNDRHLICIEDPFEVSHDLGRVVDKYSIKVLREEFERAAEIMQYDPNPCVTLFEPYVPT